VLGRRLDLQQRRVVRLLGRAAGDLESLAVKGLPQRADRVSVQRAELALDLRVIDEQEPPALRVAAARRPDGGVQDAGLDVGRDRVGPDPAHRSRGVQRLAHVHEEPLRHPI
jgi:hypothetical protein